MSLFPRGVRLGVDVGQVRVGVARSDPDGILATPLVTLSRDLTAAPGPTGGASGPGGQVSGGPGTPGAARVPADLLELARLVSEYEAVEVVVGLPVNLAGRHGPAAAHVTAYADQLAVVLDPVPVRLTDERMSTVLASRRLSERGVKGRRQRAVVDQAAAVEILQSWLDAQRRRTT